MNLKDKVILVTGAGSGIGKAIAIKCAKEGGKVIINYRKNKEGAEEVLKEVELYSEGLILQADLTIKSEVHSMFEEISKRFGTIDVLVNNAGEALSGNINDDEEIWRAQFDNIFFSALRATQYFLKMPSARLRKVLTISSLYGERLTGNSDYFPYSVAKSMLTQMAVMLAGEKNILSNIIAPGYVWTPSWEGISTKEKESIEARTMIGRFIEPSEIADCAVSVIQNDAITGEVIVIDGGVSLHNLRQK
jgi:3-oxoacyl-[acyl-carrier protein] reductase